MIKRGLLVFLFIFLVGNVSALGLSPAIVEFDFAPGEVRELTFSVHSENSEQEVEVFLGGDFDKYASLSAERLVGGGNFKLLIRFPDSVELPGRHDLGVGVREIPDEQEFIGTKVEVIGLVRINVPYPGRYAEIDLNIKDGNVNEQIPVEVHVINKGKEDFNVDASVNFLNDGKNIFDISFKPVFLKSGEDRYFRKFLDSTGFKPGNYIAEAIVNYGEEARTSRAFRIGSLFVNITNFTQALPKEGIKRFSVDIESMWNNNVDEVYADVNISNSTKSLGFRTPSANLGPWEKKTLVGFIDTSDLEGSYKTDIILYYSGQKSFASGELIVFREKSNYTIALLIGALLIIVILAILIILFVRKRNSKKVKK